MRHVIFATIISCTLFGCATSEQPEISKKTTNSNVFSIVPGSPIYAEANVSDNGTITLLKVEKITNPDITITFDFSKFDKGMMLSVKNPLNITIKYHLDMIDYKGKSHNTSSCPVYAGSGVFESWPHPIPEIQVSNIHIASKSEEGKCVY